MDVTDERYRKHLIMQTGEETEKHQKVKGYQRLCRVIRDGL